MSQHEPSKVSGTFASAMGAVKEMTGKVLGSEELAAKGAAERAEGNAEYLAAEIRASAEAEEVARRAYEKAKAAEREAKKILEEATAKGEAERAAQEVDSRAADVETKASAGDQAKQAYDEARAKVKEAQETLDKKLAAKGGGDQASDLSKHAHSAFDWAKGRISSTQHSAGGEKSTMEVRKDTKGSN